MSTKKTTAAIVSAFLFLVPFQSYSQDLTRTSTNAKFTFLDKGDKAPFDGTLFSPEATAIILNDADSSELKCDLRVQKERDLVLAKCKKDYDLAVNNLNSEIQKSKVRLTQKDEEIEALKKLASKNDYNLLWGVGGVVGGILITLGAIYVVGAITR